MTELLNDGPDGLRVGGNDAQVGQDSGTVLFSLTASTALSALIFATVLGMVAGIVPATHAARLDPVQALRHE